MFSEAGPPALNKRNRPTPPINNNTNTEKTFLFVISSSFYNRLINPPLPLKNFNLNIQNHQIGTDSTKFNLPGVIDGRISLDPEQRFR
jgi:hypothetical protein